MSNQIGFHANAWLGVNVAISGKSNAVDLENAFNIGVFGNTSGATTLTLEISADRTNWYAHPTTIAANGNFAQFYQIGARYARLSSSAAVTITATLAAK